MDPFKKQDYEISVPETISRYWTRNMCVSKNIIDITHDLIQVWLQIEAIRKKFTFV